MGDEDRNTSHEYSSLIFGLGLSFVFLVISNVLFHTISDFLMSLMISISVVGNCAQGSLMGKALLRNNFSVAILCNYLRVLIICIFVVTYKNPISVGIGILISEFLRIFIYFRELNFRYMSFDRLFLNSGIKQLTSSVISSSNSVIDRATVAKMNLGSVASLELSEKVASVVNLIFVLGILPTWSLKLRGFSSFEQLHLYLKKILIWGPILSLISICALQFVVRILLSEFKIKEILNLISIYSLNYSFLAIYQVIIRYEVLHDNLKKVTRYALFYNLLNLFGNIIFGYFLNIYGVAISSVATSAVVSLVLTTKILKKKTLK